MARPNSRGSYSNLFRAIATDLHFWIPLTVLIGGILLLDKLR
ncbi:MAG TPA: translocated intimin receptor Tir [Candidatus Dormibacteraeota bacterium]|nr:translocated intimin receptor Tir [Candidatus Dormibacteraeota bacterium]